MPFSPKALEFLFENRLHDSKAWFDEHKDIYKKYVTEPFTEVAAELAPLFNEIDPKLVCTPRRIARVRRDTRFTKDKSLFRDNIWITISREKERFEQPPCFYFGISQTGFSYGCGYYQADRDSMDTLRELILTGDKTFKAAQKAMKNQDTFALCGEMYKRSKYPDKKEELRQWLDRKNIYVDYESADFEMLFSDKLIEKVKGDFRLIVPVYRFFDSAEKLRKSAVNREADQLVQRSRAGEDF